LFHADTDGDVLADKTITVTKPDGSALGVSIYAAVSGGSPVLSPETNSVGTKLLYADYDDLDAAAVGRVKVTYSDAPATTFDEAFWPDPLDLFVDGMTRDRTLGGSLTVGGALNATNDSLTVPTLTIQNTATGRVTSVLISAVGSGYATAPTVTISGGGGTGATATAAVALGALTAVTVTANGSDFTSVPTVSFSGGGGTGAAAVAVVQSAGGLQIKGPTGSVLVDADRYADPLGHAVVMDVFSLRNGMKFNMDSTGGYLFNNRMMSVIHADATTDRVMALFHYTNSAPTAVGQPDVEPMGIIAMQAAGTDSYIRAVEIDTISNTATSSWPKIGAEISVQCADAGNLLDYTVGLSIRNLGTAWGVPTPQRLDAYISIGSDTHGAENGILYRDIDAAQDGDGPLLFKVTKTGQTHLAGIRTLTASTYTIGETSTPFLSVYADFHIMGDGIESPPGTWNPSLTYRTETGTGFSRVSAGVMNWAILGVERARMSASTWTVYNPISTSGGSANGQLLNVKTLTELTTVAAAASTDTSIQMPAGAIILAVSTRVTVAFPTAATTTIGDSGSAARFNTGSNMLTAAGTTNAGTKAGAYYNASALSVRITPDTPPANNSGRIRVTIHYIDVTAATS
jgi:hypothetical protein